MRVGTPSMGMTRPRTASSPPNDDRQISADRMATSSAPGSVSASVNWRPRMGATPRTGISSEVTTAELTRRGDSGVPRLTAPDRYAPTFSNDWLRSRNSRNSGADTQN